MATGEASSRPPYCTDRVEGGSTVGMLENDSLGNNTWTFEWLCHCTEGQWEVSSLEVELCHQVECQAQVFLQGRPSVRNARKLSLKPYSWGVESGERETVQGEQGMVKSRREMV